MEKMTRFLMIGALLIGLIGCGGTSGTSETVSGTDAQNQAPTAVINATPSTATYGTTISFDASGSSDSDGSIESYRWSEGNATLSTAVNFIKDDLGFGTHTITLTVTDDDGATGTATVDIVIQASSPLKKTGQTTCYDDRNASATIDCSDPHALKDDGYYQAGVTPNYSRDDDANIVTDHVTGLQWQDDIDAKTVMKTWAEAIAYCENLTLGGHSDWRLPTIDELMYIVDRSKYDLAIDSTFQNIVSVEYRGRTWSSTTLVYSENFAWGVVFDDGRHDDANGKGSKKYVRCVRAEN